MEVRIEADNPNLPAGSFIAVRIGEVQKQAAYDPRKVYRFPEARRFGKIDVYQHVGCCDLVWGNDDPEARVCKVVSTNGDTGMRLKVNIARPSGLAKVPNPPPAQETVDTSPTKPKSKEANAKRYLQENDVEGILTGAMRSLLKAMPEDAPGFLCNYITTYYAAKRGTTNGRPNAQDAEKKAQATARSDMAALEEKAQGALENLLLTDDGSKDQDSTSALAKKANGALDSLLQYDAGRANGDVENNADLALQAKCALESLLLHDVSNANAQGQTDVKARTHGALESLFATHVDVHEKTQLSLKAQDALEALLLDDSAEQAKPSDTADVDGCRQKACYVLIQANQEGRLEQALNEVMKVKGTQADVQKCRDKARDMVEKAAMDGSLEQAVKDASQKANDADIVATRQKACQAMVAAHESGSLEKALAAQGSKASSELQQSRDKVSASDLKAAQQSIQTSSEIEEIRRRACDILGRAADDGSLERTLMEEMPKPDDRSLQELRQTACNVMSQASKNGSLEAALRNDPSISKETEEAVRQRARNMLEKGAQDGTLERLLKEELASPEEKSLKELRHKACNVMASAAHNGSLETALKEEAAVSQEKATGALRQKACDMLTKAAHDGSLETALKQELAAPDDNSVEEAFRLRVANALCDAYSSGRLESSDVDSLRALARQDTRAKAREELTASLRSGSLETELNNVKRTMDIRKQARADLEAAAESGVLDEISCQLASQSGDRTVSSLRMQLCTSFVRATADGSLQQALTDLKGGKKAADGEYKRPSGLKNAASVGSWNQRLRKPPGQKTESKVAAKSFEDKPFCRFVGGHCFGCQETMKTIAYQQNSLEIILKSM